MTQGSDTFAGAPLIYEGMTTAATPTSGLSVALEPGEIGWGNPSFTFGRTAWWKFVATATGDISINLFHSEGVTDWEAVSPMVSLYTGDVLATLVREQWALNSDAYHATGLGSAPELLAWVEEGVTYHVQALLQDTSPDLDYRLQLARYVDVEGDWIQDPDYLYDVPQYVNSDERTCAAVFGGSKMFDALDPRLVSDYVLRPNNPVLNQTIRAAINNSHGNPVNDTWSSESATLNADVGTFRPLPPDPFPGVDTTMRNYSAAYREFTYAFRDYDALISHRFEYEFPTDFPEGALDYDWEGIERSEVLEADIKIRLVTWSEEGLALMEEMISPAALTYMFKVSTSSEIPLNEAGPLPPMPTVTNDNAATDLDSWAAGGDVDLAAADLANSITEITFEDYPYINSDGAFVMSCGIDPGGSWDPPDETGWHMNAKAFLEIAEVTYLVRPPRRRWSVRTYSTATRPYRRNIPARGDNLAGGPTRNYPPPKAQQSGRRNVGGHW